MGDPRGEHPGRSSSGRELEEPLRVQVGDLVLVFQVEGRILQKAPRQTIRMIHERVIGGGHHAIDAHHLDGALEVRGGIYSSRDQLEVSDSRLAADRSKTRGERTSILSREEYNRLIVFTHDDGHLAD